MQLPEITIANQSLLKTGFRNASQVDVFSAAFAAVFSIRRIIELNCLAKSSRSELDQRSIIEEKSTTKTLLKIRTTSLLLTENRPPAVRPGSAIANVSNPA